MQNLSTKRKKQVTRKIRRLHEVTDLGVCVCVGGGVIHINGKLEIMKENTQKIVGPISLNKLDG